MIFTKAIFEVQERKRVINTLASTPDLVAHEDGTYGWLEEKGTFQRSLGTLVLENDRLLLETTSRQRAERGKDFVKRLLGAAVKFKATAHEDVSQALKRAPRTLGKKQPDIPRELQAEIVGQFYEKHYREWVDRPSPLLETARHGMRRG